MTPDLSYYWEGAREWCEDNTWEEERKKKLQRHDYHSIPVIFEEFQKKKSILLHAKIFTFFF